MELRELYNGQLKGSVGGDGGGGEGWTVAVYFANYDAQRILFIHIDRLFIYVIKRDRKKSEKAWPTSVKKSYIHTAHKSNVDDRIHGQQCPFHFDG